MLAGYSVILTVLVLYIVSLFIRWRNLKRDLQSLKEIRKKD
jgi:HAMP domain-containing protein